MKPLSRRTFLQGAGTLVALPLLEAMIPSTARAQRPIPRRFIGYFVPCGIHMAAFTPMAEGAEFALTPILEPLAAHRSNVMVLSGLANLPGRPDGAGDHAGGTGSFLTGRHCFKTESENIKNGVSVDQVMARSAMGQATRLSSLVIGTEGGSSVGGCDSGYSCAYSRNISWAGEATPVGKEVNPRSVFDRLFAGSDPTANAVQLEKRRLYKKSILDFVSEDATRLQSKLAQTDRAKLDEYLTGVRELERQLTQAPVAQLCDVPAAPMHPMNVELAVRHMTDLMVLALQCDQTRVVSFMLGNGGSNRPFPFLNIGEGHHELSHHQDNAENHRKLQVINTWEVGELARLLDRLKAVPEGDGTLLDSTLVFWSSEIEDGNAHRHTNLPIVLAGGARIGLRPGRHVVYRNREPISNLFTTFLETMGIEAATFGDDGTGPLAGLT